jgi:hypothetical protein
MLYVIMPSIFFFWGGGAGGGWLGGYNNNNNSKSAIFLLFLLFHMGFAQRLHFPNARWPQTSLILCCEMIFLLQKKIETVPLFRILFRRNFFTVYNEKQNKNPLLYRNV